MTDLATSARLAMVATLVDTGVVTDAGVRAALEQVPREAFVPHFWTLPSGPGDPAGQFREWHADDGARALELVYDVERALGIKAPTLGTGGAPGMPAATASAPTVVAAMLGLADLEPGMRVLEIGTGSGYHAALLAELVGREGSVTSIDIDAGLVAHAAERLVASGYGRVHLVAGDGYRGCEARAPFDRVIATVGCTDLGPEWLTQLAPGGRCLIPLEHGAWHPLVDVRPTKGGVGGRLKGRTGFVPIQGRQAGRSPWPHPTLQPPERGLEWRPVPEVWIRPLRERPPVAPSPQSVAYDLGFFLALEDRRTGSALGLVDGASRALVDPLALRIASSGPRGGQLEDRLRRLVERWLQLGLPPVEAYTCRFDPLTAAPPAPAPLRWSIDRVDFRETVELDTPPPGR
jgi:protein-L-isoaspartate(D-aspartate) O-methyltransferase